MKVAFIIRSRNLIRVTADISDLFKSHSISNILVSFVETTKDTEKSLTEKEIYRAPVKPCFGSIVKKWGWAFRILCGRQIPTSRDVRMQRKITADFEIFVKFVHGKFDISRFSMSIFPPLSRHFKSNSHTLQSTLNEMIGTWQVYFSSTPPESNSTCRQMVPKFAHFPKWRRHILDI